MAVRDAESASTNGSTAGVGTMGTTMEGPYVAC